MFRDKKPEKVKVFAQNDDFVKKEEVKKEIVKVPKCPYHKEHFRNCVDCERKV